MTRGRNRFPVGILTRVGMGMLFLQAAFNPERRQGLGVAAALVPAARFWKKRRDRRAFYLRHLESFNTNPAMAGPILGAVVRLEETGAAGDPVAVKRVTRLKESLQGPFAAAGDMLLWNGARPGAGLLGSGLGMVVGFWGPLLFLVLYNVFHLGLRLGGVFWGYASGEEVPVLLRSPFFRRVGMLMQGSAAVGILALGVIALGPGTEAPGPASLGMAGALAGYVLGRRGIPHSVMIPLGAMILGLIGAFTFGTPKM